MNWLNDKEFDLLKSLYEIDVAIGWQQIFGSEQDFYQSSIGYGEVIEIKKKLLALLEDDTIESILPAWTTEKITNAHIADITQIFWTPPDKRRDSNQKESDKQLLFSQLIWTVWAIKKYVNDDNRTIEVSNETYTIIWDINNECRDMTVDVDKAQTILNALKKIHEKWDIEGQWIGIQLKLLTPESLVDLFTRPDHRESSNIETSEISPRGTTHYDDGSIKSMIDSGWRTVTYEQSTVRDPDIDYISSIPYIEHITKDWIHRYIDQTGYIINEY